VTSCCASRSVSPSFSWLVSVAPRSSAYFATTNRWTTLSLISMACTRLSSARWSSLVAISTRRKRSSPSAATSAKAAKITHGMVRWAPFTLAYSLLLEVLNTTRHGDPPMGAVAK